MAAEESNPPRAGSDWLVPPGEQEGLRSFVTTLRERIRLIVAIAVLTAAASIAYVALATKTFEAAAGILAGLVLGITAAFAFQALDPRLRREEQLRHLFRIPIIGRVPREAKGSSDMPLSPRLISPATAEAYRTLRGTVSASSRRPGGEVLLVTGSSPSEGKTTTAIDLAASLSETGSRVILIEANLHRPRSAARSESSPSAASSGC